ncbi:hypothetical protein E4U32_002648 [Claviceps aff. humidiphila group G2b]|nr:hypothetical protein E4U32_002648 [Claviceps aff. humidiphila group G2b]
MSRLEPKGVVLSGQDSNIPEMPAYVSKLCLYMRPQPEQSSLGLYRDTFHLDHYDEAFANVIAAQGVNQRDLWHPRIKPKEDRF